MCCSPVILEKNFSQGPHGPIAGFSEHRHVHDQTQDLFFVLVSFVDSALPARGLCFFNQLHNFTVSASYAFPFLFFNFFSLG